MRYSEQFKEHIEYTFNAFCKTVLRNAAINAYRDMKREQKREVSLNYLMSETSFEPFTMDIYFMMVTVLPVAIFAAFASSVSMCISSVKLSSTRIAT